MAPDLTQAVQWYRKAADKGHAAARGQLGLCYQYVEFWLDLICNLAFACLAVITILQHDRTIVRYNYFFPPDMVLALR